MLTGSGGHTPNSYDFLNYISLSQYPIWYSTPQTIERQFGPANLEVGKMFDQTDEFTDSPVFCLDKQTNVGYNQTILEQMC